MEDPPDIEANHSKWVRIQILYYVYFWTNTVGKCIKPLCIFQYGVNIYWLSTRLLFALKNHEGWCVIKERNQTNII